MDQSMDADELQRAIDVLGEALLDNDISDICGLAALKILSEKLETLMAEEGVTISVSLKEEDEALH